MNVEMTVNGKKVKADTSPSLLLSDFLRENLISTGTHVGCDTSQCGACVVHIDGVSMKSCTLLAVSVDGKSVTTIEGLADCQCRSASDAAGLPRQSRPAVRLLHARHDHERGRFCQATPNPTERDVRHWLEGNICRCTGYQNIVAAVLAGAAAMQTQAGG